MRPVRRFEVRPTIPAALAALPELATNLHWTWDRELVRLFERIWPGWSANQAHPAHMVRTTSTERLAALAEDQSIVRDLAAAKGRLDAAITGPAWFVSRHIAPRRRVERRDADSVAAGDGRLLLARVRPHRGAAAVLRRPRRARPVTTSRRRRTSACRSSASACCTPRATSTRSSTPAGGSRSGRSTWTPSRSGSATPACASRSTSPATR